MSYKILKANMAETAELKDWGLYCPLCGHRLKLYSDPELAKHPFEWRYVTLVCTNKDGHKGDEVYWAPDIRGYRLAALLEICCFKDVYLRECKSCGRDTRKYEHECEHCFVSCEGQE